MALANVLRRGSSGQQGKHPRSDHLLAKVSSLLRRSTSQRHMLLLLLADQAARKLSLEDKVDQLQFQLGRSLLSHKYQFQLQ
jgi:hypothetical protein